MQKDFTKWFLLKQSAHGAESGALFHEREIWWCKIGANVGFEIDGGGKDFERPVIVIKKFNLDTCIVIPLTAKTKTGKYYFPIGTINGRDATVILSQIRLIDRKRLAEKIETLPKVKFKELLNAIVHVNFTI
jgi:mRNA interferase MazF